MLKHKIGLLAYFLVEVLAYFWIKLVKWHFTTEISLLKLLLPSLDIIDSKNIKISLYRSLEKMPVKKNYIAILLLNPQKIQIPKLKINT